MPVNIKIVSNKSDLRKFIYLPEKIHKDHPNWVHPIYMDEWVFFNPKKNKYFQFSDVILLLAFKGDKPVGRVMGVINHRYNELHNEYNGRFAFLDCYDDQKVAHALLEYVENWVKLKGLKKIVGPLAFSDKDPQGFLIEGYEQLPVVATNYNLPYIVKIVENEGYGIEKDLCSYQIVIPETFDDKYEKIFQRIYDRGNFRLVKFKRHRDLKPYIRPILTLVNKAFEKIYAHMPFEEKEMDDFANRYLAILRTDFIKVIKKGDEIVAFIIAIPDISKGIQKAKGHIFPFGFIHILRSQKTTDRLDLLLGAVKEEYRGFGLDTILGVKLIESAKKAGLKFVDSHVVLEENYKMRGEMEKLGGNIYKRYRIFQKQL
jgi:hypothetical protein